MSRNNAISQRFESIHRNDEPGLDVDPAVRRPADPADGVMSVGAGRVLAVRRHAQPQARNGRVSTPAQWNHDAVNASWRRPSTGTGGPPAAASAQGAEPVCTGGCGGRVGLGPAWPHGPRSDLPQQARPCSLPRNTLWCAARSNPAPDREREHSRLARRWTCGRILGAHRRRHHGNGHVPPRHSRRATVILRHHRRRRLREHRGGLPVRLRCRRPRQRCSVMWTTLPAHGG
jgi:hypothetical protein